ncbi:MAG: oxidoreductase [Deltaproteobacteria bacterium]|nr:oxidoreductase [Deltaproteobacteria bacterium]
MKRQALFFTGPRRVEVREEPLEAPRRGQVLVQTLLTAISAGSELLVYQGAVDPASPADPTLSSLAGTLAYPLKYGYAAVGQVVETGPGVGPEWQERRVFAFQPHQSYFVAEVADLLVLPPELAPEQAVLLPNLETALSLVQDGAPLIGQKVAVLGQGVVGLLTTWLLAKFPLATLLTLEPLTLRRELSSRLGAQLCLDPTEPTQLALAGAHLGSRGADLVYELSGQPAALGLALELAGYAASVVVGSWYGTRAVNLSLGERFHRGRQTITSSQVSTLAPGLSGRWDKPRRLAFALDLARQVDAGLFITQRRPLEEAPLMYDRLDRFPGSILQVVLSYE